MEDLLVKAGRYVYKYSNPNPKNYKPNLQEYSKEILSAKNGNLYIKNVLEVGEPAMISRYGSVELNTIVNFFEINQLKKLSKFKRLISRIQWKSNTWEKEILKTLETNAGFFPINENSVDGFSRLYINDSEQIDALGVWFNYGENKLHTDLFPEAVLMPLVSIEPYYFDDPWSVNLYKKRVLVIHPFIKTIENQYKKRELLFYNKDILPNFELLTIRAHQSNAGNKVLFNNWFDALDNMKSQIDKLDFDIALIGAGAYGLPLAAHVKRIGKQAIHMGGALQLLFGIRGGRWDNNLDVNKFYNEYWTSPLPEETPEGFKKVEDGCYW